MKLWKHNSPASVHVHGWGQQGGFERWRGWIWTSPKSLLGVCHLFGKAVGFSGQLLRLLPTIFFSKMKLKFDVQFDQRELRKSKSAEVHLFDIEPPSISSSLERDKVIRFGTI